MQWALSGEVSEVGLSPSAPSALLDTMCACHQLPKESPVQHSQACCERSSNTATSTTQSTQTREAPLNLKVRIKLSMLQIRCSKYTNTQAQRVLVTCANLLPAQLLYSQRVCGVPWSPGPGPENSGRVLPDSLSLAHRPTPLSCASASLSHT
jgi:hypothetical protein